MVKRVSIISYLNTLPFLYGLKRSSVVEEIQFDYSPPSEALRRLLANKSDIGIVPSAGLIKQPALEVVSDFSISADGEVASVLLCSDKPLREIGEVLLDDHSVTSALLLKVLFKHFWNRSPHYSSFNFEKESIEYSKSYLLIGDKALIERDNFNYIYDLAAVWKEFTSLPFVFACWSSSKKLGDSFLERFNEALAYGVNNIAAAVESEEHSFPKEEALNYLTNNILYPLSDASREGLALYHKLASTLL